MNSQSTLQNIKYRLIILYELLSLNPQSGNDARFNTFLNASNQSINNHLDVARQFDLTQQTCNLEKLES